MGQNWFYQKIIIAEKNTCYNIKWVNQPIYIVYNQNNEREWAEVETGKGGQIYGDQRRLDFGWWAHGAIYRWRILELYT